MLLAIDVGNSHSHLGLWDGGNWVDRWTLPTDHATLLNDTRGEKAKAVAFASVVPPVNPTLQELAERLTGKPATQLAVDPRLGVEIHYEPPTSLGADRLANVLGALTKFKPPIVVVDIGTATTFEAIDSTGAFVGGAILAGAQVALDALVKATAQLPNLRLEGEAPAVGANTIDGLRTGAVYGHAGAIQAIATRMVEALGAETTVVATGGLCRKFAPLCPVIQHVEEALTLDGIVAGFQRLSAG